MSEKRQNTISIEQLRAGVENEHRFQTVFRGYDKKDVNEYLQELADNYQRTIDDLNRKRESNVQDITDSYEKLLAELKQKNESTVEKIQGDSEREIAGLKEENQQLRQQVDALTRQLEDVSKKLENREENEKKVRETVMAGMRDANNRLSDENRKKEMKITQLEEQMQDIKTDVSEYTQMLVKLNEKLKEMLEEKVSECESVISAWEQQFCVTAKSMEEQMK